jgi:hypothetical protein
MIDSSRGKSRESLPETAQLSHRTSVELIEIEQDELPTAVDLAG